MTKRNRQSFLLHLTRYQVRANWYDIFTLYLTVVQANIGKSKWFFLRECVPRILWKLEEDAANHSPEDVSDRHSVREASSSEQPASTSGSTRSNEEEDDEDLYEEVSLLSVTVDFARRLRRFLDR